MTRFAIDAPTLLRLATPGARIDPGHQLVAPKSIRTDALALLLSGVRSGALTEPEALEQHEHLTAVKIRMLGDRVSRRVAWRLARDLDWDDLRSAEYLAVARLQSDFLVTLDPELARRADGVVPVAEVERLYAGRRSPT